MLQEALPGSRVGKRQVRLQMHELSEVHGGVSDMFKRHGEIRTHESKCDCDNGYNQERMETVSDRGRRIYTYVIKKCSKCDGTGKR